MWGRKSSQRDLKMIWTVRKNSRQSFLVGTAHFFPYSFKASLSGYIKEVRHVLLEGPLDDENMSKVVEAGRTKDRAHHLFDLLDGPTVERIHSALAPACRAPNTFLLFNLLGPKVENPIRAMIEGMAPWLAFFTLWSGFLKKNGWKYSVDLEAYQLALESDKNIVPLETIEEQIGVLESIITDQIVDFLKRIEKWPYYADHYRQWYLSGDLTRIQSNIHGFPTRQPSVIERRDEILFERLLSYFEQGEAMACVGAPHVKGIINLLFNTGYEVTRDQGARK